MKAWNVYYHRVIVSREYAESSWEAIDKYASKHEERVRNAFYAVPVAKHKKPDFTKPTKKPKYYPGMRRNISA